MSVTWIDKIMNNVFKKQRNQEIAQETQVITLQMEQMIESTNIALILGSKAIAAEDAKTTIIMQEIGKLEKENQMFRQGFAEVEARLKAGGL